MNIYSVKMTETMGRGVFAEKDFGKGDIITNCEVLVLSEKDTTSINATDLQYYTFKYNEAQDCLVLGDGEIFNHDNNANVIYGLIEFDGRKLMQFQAIRPIKKGEQLFIDYNYDIQVDTHGYMTTKSLI